MRHKPKHRTDRNQSTIIDAFKAHEATVVVLSGVGFGCPDLLVGWRGWTFLVEVRNPESHNGDTPAQQRFREAWSGGRVQMVDSVVAVNRLLVELRIHGRYLF